ncbi:MAG: glycyl-radical enzyme activating protein [Oscillospiraceae bacterium]|nr:glycyl-radical enzyme activating protein [Oscillospiraceae bacterium]
MTNVIFHTGVIFDIKEFALHDGPGVRTTVFFKGCPLRCVWCHNPEGLSPKLQLMTKESSCKKCGSCAVSCSHEECQPFGRCIYACPDALISVCGREMTCDELFDRLMKDAGFLRESEGGITFSGGEPLMQPEFLAKMLDRLREADIHTAIETCGYARPEIFREIAGKTDLVIMDLKLADEELHRKYTGVSNRWILENAAWLKESGKAHIFRTPLIPGITDTEENLAAIKAIIGDSEHELLPYNELAGAKYPMLGETYRYDQMKGSVL